MGGNDFMEIMQYSNFVKRGQLIRFKCHFDGMLRCSWDAIFHGSDTGHIVGKRKQGSILLGRLFGEDKITKINHGYLIERFI